MRNERKFSLRTCHLEECGHFRRYSKASLAAAFDAAGLDVVTLRYSNPIGLLGGMFNAHVLKTRALSMLTTSHMANGMRTAQRYRQS